MVDLGGDPQIAIRLRQCAEQAAVTPEWLLRHIVCAWLNTPRWSGVDHPPPVDPGPIEVVRSASSATISAAQLHT